MNERLTDADLERLQRYATSDLCVSSEVGSMIAELRERRASDLTDFDRTVLAVLRGRIADDPLGDRAMIAALDKILGNK